MELSGKIIGHLCSCDTAILIHVTRVYKSRFLGRINGKRFTAIDRCITIEIAVRRAFIFRDASTMCSIVLRDHVKRN